MAKLFIIHSKDGILDAGNVKQINTYLEENKGSIKWTTTDPGDKLVLCDDKQKPSFPKDRQ